MARSFLLLYFTLTLPDFPNPPNLKCPTRGVHSSSSKERGDFVLRGAKAPLPYFFPLSSQERGIQGVSLT
jgi:hypothetical protein